MLRLFKWLLLSVIALILILGIAVIWLVVFVDPNSYKPQLEKLARQQGVELQLRGDLNWQFFPDLGVRLVDTSAKIPAQGIEQLDVRELALALDKSKLLKRRVEFSSIYIEGADLLVRTVEDAGKAIAAPVIAGSAGESADTPADSNLIALAINQFVLADSRITVAQADGDLVLTDLNLSLDNINLDGQSISLDLSSNIQSEELQPVNFSMEGSVIPKFGNDSVILSDLAGPNADKLLEQLTLQISPTILDINYGDMPISLGLEGGYQQSTQSLNLEKLRITVNEQPFNGRFQLALASPRNLNLFLQGKTLTIPPAKESGVEEEEAAAALLTPLLAPLAILEGGRGQIELKFDQFNFETYRVGNLHLNVLANGNIVQLSRLSGKTFDGSFSSDARIDLQGRIPALQFSLSLANMDAQQLTKAAAEMEDISGVLNMEFSGQGQGDTVDAIQQSLLGTGKLHLVQPVVKNINVEQSVCEVSELLSNSYSSTFDGTTTRFTDINSDLAFNRGIASLKNLTTSTGNLHVVANGDVDTLKKRVNLQLKANIRGNKSSENGCSVNKRLRNVDIPIRCSGPLEGEISCRPDQSFLQSLLQNVVKDELVNRLLKDRLGVTDQRDAQPDTQQPGQTEAPAKKSDAERVGEALDLLRGLIKKE